MPTDIRQFTIRLSEKQSGGLAIKNNAAGIDIAPSENNTATFSLHGLVVTFNGGADVNEDDALFADAEKIARSIVQRGGIVMNGGRNGGIMEATCRGARDHCLGILFQEQTDRCSQYGQKVIVNSPTTRLEILSSFAPHIIVYPGNIGTLQELVFGLITRKNSILYGVNHAPHLILHVSWREILDFLVHKERIKKQYVDNTVYFHTADDIIPLLR